MGGDSIPGARAALKLIAWGGRAVTNVARVDRAAALTLHLLLGRK